MEARRHAETEAITQANQGRKARQDEKRRLAAGREGVKLREQEAFEQRAAAYFERTELSLGPVKRKGKSKQLEWPL